MPVAAASITRRDVKGQNGLTKGRGEAGKLGSCTLGQSRSKFYNLGILFMSSSRIAGMISTHYKKMPHYARSKREAHRPRTG